MAIVISTILRDQIASLVAPAIDTCIVRDAGGATIATFSSLAWTASGGGSGAMTLTAGGGPVTISGTGVATTFRLQDATDIWMTGTCGTTGSGEDLEFNDVNLVSGASLTITSWSITFDNCP